MCFGKSVKVENLIAPDALIKMIPKITHQCKSCNSKFAPKIWNYYIDTYISFLYIDEKYMSRSLKCLLPLQEMNSSMKWHFYINFLAKNFPKIRNIFFTNFE